MANLEWTPSNQHYVLDNTSLVQRSVHDRFRTNIKFLFGTLGPKFAHLRLSTRGATHKDLYLNAAIDDIGALKDLESVSAPRRFLGSHPCYPSLGLYAVSGFNPKFVKVLYDHDKTHGKANRVVGMFQQLDARTVGVGMHDIHGSAEECFSAVIKI